MTAQIYGASPVKRVRMTNDQLQAIDASIKIVLDEEHQATVRSVFYRVMSLGMVPKTENGYRLVGRQLLKLRRNEEIPYGWISDGTRYVIHTDSYSSASYALELTAKYYRRNVWINQADRVMVFTEKDALRGVLQPITDRYDVELGVMRGYSSESFTYEVAMSLPGRQTTYLYQLGDHDPSGVDAWRSFEQKIREFNPTARVEFERIAVTPQQIQDMQLPTRPTKKTDTRSKSFVGGSVEVDAIAPSVLRKILENAIVQHLDMNAYQAMKQIEIEEQHKLREIATQLREVNS